jgi:YHS domain-containing protein
MTEMIHEMETPLCSTCGCSLVRLHVGKSQSVMYLYDGKEHLFCCRACANVFANNPEKYIQEIHHIVVCPVCLAEKPKELTVKMNYDGKEFRFCRCPHCAEEFTKRPNYFINRISSLS